MKFHSLRSSLLALLAFGLAGLLTSCGGGGAASTPTGGAMLLSPSVGTFYAGIPVTFNITGGRPPYTVASSEPSLLPVPTTVGGNSFTTVPSNPGVVNVGLAPGELPVRTVVITVRDSTGIILNSTGIQVAQNFLTGYGPFSRPCRARRDRRAPRARWPRRAPAAKPRCSFRPCSTATSSATGCSASRS